jgi:hypothetical protein
VLRGPQWQTHALSVLCLSVVLVSCGGVRVATTFPVPPNALTVTSSPESIVLTTSQRNALGFQYGPPDGTIGVLANGGAYTFFMAGGSTSTCTGTPFTGGTYRLGGSLTSINASYGCSAAITPSPDGDPNGYTFDRDYAGGGPVLAVTSAAGAAGVLHIYHGESQGGACSGLGKCFYSSLGMAISKDRGATFSKLGEILQPYVTRSSIINANANLEVGGGTLLIADGNGQHIPNLAAADPSSVFLYVFYSDLDPAAATSSPCNQDSCLAVARAPLAQVVEDAFSGNTAAFPTLFKKFYKGGFTEPGTSGDPNAAANSGHYTPVIATPGSFPSVLYDAAIQQYLIAYTTGNNTIQIRHGSALLSWSSPVASGTITHRPNSILYPTLIGDGADPATGNGEPWLFYVTAPSWPDWSTAALVSRRLQLANK